jgi:hypothetical protein
MSARTAPRALAAVAGVVAVAITGCGVGAGSTPDAPIALTVTRDFGARAMIAIPDAKVAGEDTVMRVLQRNVKVTTRFGGQFVQSINGVSGGRRDGRPVDWFLYVNGILTSKGATAVEVRGGDRVWWDHHDWAVTPDSRAIVGAFPEPFVHGSDGKRLPVRVECADPTAGACAQVAKKLLSYGVPVGRSSISRSAADESLRVLVGPWSELRGGDAESDALDDGPKASGVFARFEDEGRALAVLDERGRIARTLGRGSGLVAATRAKERQPVWFVTGTDEAGVVRAARAFDEATLVDRFALAISDDDLPVAAPAKAP